MILNCIKEIAVNSPVFIGSIVVIVLLIGITKEGITDYSRHKSDSKVNSVVVNRISNRYPNAPDHIEKSTLRAVEVGDVILLDDNQ